jgi:hypothetical protein
VPQREIRPQLINKLRGHGQGQVVGDLWISSRGDADFPHRGLQGVDTQEKGYDWSEFYPSGQD